MEKAWGRQTVIQHPKARSVPSRPLVGLLFLLVWGSWFLFRNFPSSPLSQPTWKPTAASNNSPKCPQVDPLFPDHRTEALDAMSSFIHSAEFGNESIARLQAAVQIRTESFDDLGEVGVDPRWDVFYPFAAFLKSTFPHVHGMLQVESVHEHGLLYTWNGSDTSLKPTLLMAHQDVVPVPESTVKQWTHPPFSGYNDGKFIWGRGSSDCKNQLIGILSAVEALVASGFEPKRTLILSFGFDEEVSGQEGARYLSEHLLQKYGHNSIGVIVDEGAGTAEAWGANFALPGVAEKGYVDVDFVVRMPGGHSSIPPQHNGIGVASELITLIESDLYSPELKEGNPFLDLLYCGAEHSPNFPSKLKGLLKHREDNHGKHSKKDKLAQEVAKADPAIRYLMQTSVAVDLINGGVKTNALPERTAFTVNHRINVGSSSKPVLDKLKKLAEQIAHKYNLTVHAFDGEETPESISLSYRDTKLEPAPVTPTHGKSSTPFKVLSGTTRALYGEDLLVSPGIMTGNTDTRYYWDLSEHIFRYGPGWDKEQEGLGNIHTVNEKVSIKAHVDNVKWFFTFIRNADEADF